MNTAVPRVNPSEETIVIGNTSIRFVVTGEDSNGSVAVFELGVPVGDRLRAPAHSHDHYEETIFVTHGVLTFTVNGERIDISAGEALCVPRGAVHSFANEGDDDVRAIVSLSPAAIGPAFFRESSQVLADAAGGPPDRARMMDIFQRYGLTPAPPPSPS